MKSKSKLFSFFKKLGSEQKKHSHHEIPDFEDSSDVEKTKPDTSNKDVSNLSKAEALAKGISMLVGIYFVNDNNQTEKRRITIRRIWQKDLQMMIDAFCHETKAPRIFPLSRIKKIVDLKTKKAFSDPNVFISSQILLNEKTPSKTTSVAESDINNNNPALRAINSVRNELTCLVFLAQTDNDFSVAEKKVIANYVIKRNPNSNIEMSEINEYISRIYPDEESFYDAIDDLLNKSEEILTEFVETFIKLILSDGIIHDNEREFLAELLLILKEEGIQIKTKIQ